MDETNKLTPFEWIGVAVLAVLLGLILFCLIR